MYDYLVVGAGLFGAVFAHEAKKAGKKVLVIDKREHVAGNIYTKEVDGNQAPEYNLNICLTISILACYVKRLKKLSRLFNLFLSSN